MKKSRRIASFLTLSSSNIEEVSQNCFIFDVVNFENEEVSQHSLVFRLADRQVDRQTDRQIDRRERKKERTKERKKKERKKDR